MNLIAYFERSDGFVFLQRVQTQQVGKVEENIRYTIQKDSKNNCNKINEKSTDDSIESKIFPHLFPDGKGYYIRNKIVSLAQYFRLLHVDSRWRDDRFYKFHVYDRLTGERILAVNSIIKSRSTLADKNNVKSLLKNEYFEYGYCVPICITGSKAYWKSKNYNFVSIVSLPVMFLTLTANYSWCELKSILSGNKKTRIECQNRGSLHPHKLL
ncbi:DNA helicase ATP [Brachionus plicatilis]|uniref:DNA helicase ATP n=1 Tax=Brachionus plicatilis TaxID=10195 RepID=A0A3M7SIT1_BRAPC|nr:DNA helicase ATP [Brachionus plicatilis]